MAQDYAKAREWYEKAAAKGNAGAMINLGLLYDNGHGVAQDYAKAREWYEKAAAKGNADAMANLGLLYENGQGVAQDYAKAREWYEKAAAKGNASAMTNLGLLYTTVRAWRRTTPRRASGTRRPPPRTTRAPWPISACFTTTVTAWRRTTPRRASGTRRPPPRATRSPWSTSAVLYDNGQGVAQDYAKAREWYEKAADKGDAEAKTALEQLTIQEAAAAGRYAEALQLQEALAAKVEAVETKREGKPGKETAEALNDVAWYALFAREFTKALTVADRAHALLPDDLTIETNRAHALMFLGREKEAKALYLAHKGKPISEQDARLWERVIAEDFAEFRKAGLTHPMMADIEKELGVSR